MLNNIFSVDDANKKDTKELKLIIFTTLSLCTTVFSTCSSVSSEYKKKKAIKNTIRQMQLSLNTK